MSKKIKLFLPMIGIIISIALAIYTIFCIKSNSNDMNLNNKIGNGRQTSSEMAPPNSNMKNGNNKPGQINSNDNTQNSTNSSSDSTTGQSSDNLPQMNDNNMEKNQRNIPSGKFTPDNMKKENSKKLSTTNICMFVLSSLIFSISLLYLLFSKFGSKLVFISKASGVIYILSSLIATVIISVALSLCSSKLFLKNSDIQNFNRPEINNDTNSNNTSTTTNNTTNLTTNTSNDTQNI